MLMQKLPKVTPAVIPQSFEHLKDTLVLVGEFSSGIQIDIVDGVFVQHSSWPYVPHGNIRDIAPYISNLEVEVDLMIDRPERVLEEYLVLGVTHVVIHLEAVQNLEQILEMRKRFSFKLGFSINNDTPFSVLQNVLMHADYVQLMGIAHIGVQRQPFDRRVLTYIREVRLANPGILISVDGSVNAESITLLKDAGVDRFVSGSAILSAEHPKKAYEGLFALV